MEEYIPKELLTPGVLIGLFVVSVWKGWLIPKLLHQERIADKDSQIIAEREEKTIWRDAAKENAIQVTQLTSGLASVEKLLGSIQDVLEESSDRAR